MTQSKDQIKHSMTRLIDDDPSPDHETAKAALEEIRAHADKLLLELSEVV